MGNPDPSNLAFGGRQQALPGFVKNFRATHLYSWNVFRYVGDALHLSGILVLLGTLMRNQTCAGVSLKTNIIYFLLFCCRYLDLFAWNQRSYLIAFKMTYILATGMTLVLFWKWKPTYEAHKDTVNLWVIVVPCLVAACLLTAEFSPMEMLWTYSQFLEAFALVPQYVYSYRDPGNKDKGIFAFILCIGSYRCFYAMNWIYKKANEPHYSDIQSWLGGILEICFFADYLVNQCGGSSILKTLTITVDDKIREVSDKIELRVLGTTSEGRDGLRKRRGVNDYDELDMLDV